MDKNRKKALKNQAKEKISQEDYLRNHGGFPRAGLMHMRKFNPEVSALSDDEYLKFVLSYIADAMFPLEEQIPEIDINTVNSEDDSVLHYACTWGDVRAVRLIIEAGANVNHLGDMEKTPLHYAVNYRFLDIVELLLEKGATQTKDAFGYTPLESANLYGYTDIAKVLNSYKNNSEDKVALALPGNQSTHTPHNP